MGSEIKVVEIGEKKQVFIDDVKQNNVVKVEVEVLPGEITIAKISYYIDKFEVVREPVKFDEYGCPVAEEGQ